jgi:hypothetical protein
MTDWSHERSGTLNRLLWSVLDKEDGRVMPRACPVCGVVAGHVYLHHLEREWSSVWAWCSDCRNFLRGVMRAPRWWRDLDLIDPAQLQDESKLAATPHYLDDMKTAIDRHWQTLPPRRKAPIVEFRHLKDTGQYIAARFVLTDAGIVVVGPTENSVKAAEETVTGGLPGPGGRYVQRDEGMEFLRLLTINFRGSRFWATPVVEMDEEEAMTSFPRPPRW